MNREDKLQALKAISSGMPTRFALQPEKYNCLFGNKKTQEEGYYVTRDLEKVTISDKERYLPESFVFLNVSLQYPDYLPIASDLQ